MPEYSDFEIVVEKVGDSDNYAVTVRQACEGRAGDASSSFNLSEIMGQFSAAGHVTPSSETRDLVLSSDTSIQYKQTLTNPFLIDSAEEIGRKLTLAIFKREISELWGECKQYQPIRIRLDLTSAPELMALPWEYMRSTDDSTFANLDKNTTIARYLRTASPVRPLEIEPPLRILLVASAPKDLAVLGLDNEICEIKKAFSELNRRYIDIVVLKDATIAAFRKTLRDARDSGEPFHVFHFLGHGGFNSTRRKGVLIFEDDQKKGVAVEGEQLGLWLQEFSNDLRLIVLNACQGATLSTTDSYSSVATKIMEVAEIPAAFAMQFNITDRAAITFAKIFYGQIAAGINLELSAKRARMAVSDLGGTAQEWATPVFYLRAKSGDLIHLDIPTPPIELAPHYSAIKRALPKAEIVFFLGLNINIYGRPKIGQWKPGTGVPTNSELCSYLSSQININPAMNSLAGIAQVMKVRDKNLNNQFYPIFGGSDDQVSELYDILARLTKVITTRLTETDADKSLLFVTTTYDRQLEKAFEENSINNYHVIRYEGDKNGDCWFWHQQNGVEPPMKPFRLDASTANTYMGWRGTEPVILKLPGEVDGNSNFAVTEDDFLALAAKPLSDLIPPDVLTQLKESGHLYLGYDLQSWPLRLLKNKICEGQSPKGQGNSCVVLNDGDPTTDFWRGTEVEKASLEDYFAGLEQNVLYELLEQDGEQL